jgi:hypothetical protein
MKLNVWKHAQEMETLILHLESRIDNLESVLASVLTKPRVDPNWISKMKEKELLDKRAQQRAYSRKYYQKKKAERQEAK